MFSIRAHGFARDDVDAQDCRTRARSDAIKSSARALRERERERERGSKQAGGQEGLGRPGQEKRAEAEMRS